MSKTILKWAGNKSKVMPLITPHFPKTFGAYVEPFAGALGSYLNSGVDPLEHDVHLCDLNSEIMNLYELFRQDWHKVMTIANELGRDSKSYYEIRAWDREDSWPSIDMWQKAARTVYLNKQAFNGLYRTNKNTGYFNTPYCKKAKKGDLVNEQVAIEFVKAIENVSIYNESFEDFLQRDFGDNALYYFDPPYVDLKNPNVHFEGYQCKFGLAEQIELEEWMENLSKKGHTVITSNSMCPTTKRLYRNYETHTIQVRRSIGAKASSRGMVDEIIAIAK